MVFEERRIEVGGLPTRYLEAGAGELLVVLHALGESAFDWRWVLGRRLGRTGVDPDAQGCPDGSGGPGAAGVAVAPEGLGRVCRAHPWWTKIPHAEPTQCPSQKANLAALGLALGYF